MSEVIVRTDLQKKYNVMLAPKELRGGIGWIPYFTIAEHHDPFYTDDTEYWGRKSCESKEAAMEVCRILARRVIVQRETQCG